MVQLDVFPGGKKHCVTFSYDDGCDNDARLVSMLNRYGMKGTFHLNGINYRGYSDEDLEKVGTVYQGHEISCHTYSHCYPTRMPEQAVVAEIMEDRRMLEKIAGYPMMGLSYPYGSCSDQVSAILNPCGMRYGRTTKSTHDFLLPRDFMLWHPTCHHHEATEMAKEFMRRIERRMISPLLYIWGHSSEFKTEEQWAEFETVLKVLSQNDKIWFATNKDIVLYAQAQKNLQISVDENMYYNPSAVPVWIEKNKEEIICIPAGETVVL